MIPEGSRSFVDEIGEFSSKVLGVDLMPWQLRYLRGATAMDDAGDYLNRISVCSVARQNGKSTVMSAVIGWFLCLEAPRRGKPQTVISAAHKLDLGSALFNYLAPILETKFSAVVSWSYGRQSCRMPDGTIWMVRAATPQAGHGHSVDLYCIDEIWSVSEEAIFDGFLPSQRARKNPLCLMFSTAGTQESKAFLRFREQGLRAIDAGTTGSIHYAEWSPPNVDLMTPEAWAYANPALGYTLDMKVIESEAQAPNRAAFLRASVNTWQATTTSWLEPGIFAELKTSEPIPAGGWLAVEASMDDSRYCGVRSVTVDRITYSTVAFIADTMTEVWKQIDHQIQQNPNLKIAITPLLHQSAPTHLERRMTVVGYKELLRWTLGVRAQRNEGRLRHDGSTLLEAHVDRAVLIKHNGSMGLSSTRSPGAIELARCLVFSAALASKPQQSGKPTVMVFAN